MRMPRVRFSVRGLMVAVVIAACAIGGWIALERRRADFLRRATSFAPQNHLGTPPAVGIDKGNGLIHLDWEQWGREDRYAAAMAAKYERAARYPWLPVAPDPPEPPEPK
jgi:hypothetical protein